MRTSHRSGGHKSATVEVRRRRLGHRPSASISAPALVPRGPCPPHHQAVDHYAALRNGPRRLRPRRRARAPRLRPLRLRVVHAICAAARLHTDGRRTRTGAHTKRSFCCCYHCCRVWCYCRLLSDRFFRRMSFVVLLVFFFNI